MTHVTYRLLRLPGQTSIAVLDLCSIFSRHRTTCDVKHFKSGFVPGSPGRCPASWTSHGFAR